MAGGELAGFRSLCMRCGLPGRRPRIAPPVWPSWSAPIRSAPTIPRPTLSASCIARCAPSDRSSFKRPTPSGAGGRRARRRSRRLLASRRSGPSQPSSDKSRPERDPRPAARRLGQCDHRDRPAHVGLAGRGDRRADRRGRACFFRRDRPDRPPSFDQYGRGLDAVALRQGRAGRAGRRLCQLPDEPRPVRRLHRRAAGSGKDRVSRIRGHALFRRLPADRSDGRARARDPASRPDEAVRAHQRPQSDRSSPTPSSSSGRTMRSARCSTWSASRPSSNMASRGAFSA